jgi:MYXO-CTERM domain-containing protein
VAISIGLDPNDIQSISISTLDLVGPLPRPQISLDLVQEPGLPHALTSTGAPTSLSPDDFLDKLVQIETGTLPQQLVGNWFVDQLSVAPSSVDEPGSLPVLAMGLFAFVGLPRLRRQAGAVTCTEIASAG